MESSRIPPLIVHDKYVNNFNSETTEETRKEIADTSKDCVTIKSAIPVNDPLNLIKEGWLPTFIEDIYENYTYGNWNRPTFHSREIILEDIALYQISEDEIKFWFGTEYQTTVLNLPMWQFWKYCTIEYHKRVAMENAQSLPLLLYAPDQVYSISKRPKTDMQIFRTPGAVILNKSKLGGDSPYLKTAEINDSEWNLIPVTRYAAGMSRGLYYGEEASKYYGTYYYLEPQSTTYLSFRTSLVFRNKYQAVDGLKKILGLPIVPLFDVFQGPHPDLSPEDNRVLDQLPDYRSKREYLKSKFGEDFKWYHDTDHAGLAYLKGKSDRPEDLMFTPLEAFDTFRKEEPGDRVFNGWTREAVAALPQTRRYLGKFLDLYGLEDVFDEIIYEMAVQAGYDIIILTHMVGSHQIVSEILDIRNRSVSFDTLVYVVE